METFLSWVFGQFSSEIIFKLTRAVFGLRIEFPRDNSHHAIPTKIKNSKAQFPHLKVSLWVPFWIVNRSGIPLIIKQLASDKDAAGQVADHEKAKDRNALMFSFSDDTCPNQCVARVGRTFSHEPGFKPQFSRSFPLVPGVQSLKLLLAHDHLPARWVFSCVLRQRLH